MTATFRCLPRAARAAAALLLCAAPRASRAQGEPAFTRNTWYTVEIPAHDRRLARIDARIELTDSVLIMFPEGADHLPGGWATYLRGLQARDDAGRSIRLRPAGRDRWIVPRPFPRAVRLRYEVLLHHDAGQWPFGAKEAGYVREDGVFVTGKALFVTQRIMRPAQVRFRLPAGWRVATPWAPVARDSMTYFVPHTSELLQVGMLAGRHQERHLRLGGSTVVLAVGRSLPNTLDLFEETLSPALRGATSLFGGTPRGTFVAIANADSYDGGTAFTRSFDVVFREPPSRANRATWGHIMIHELLHMWLGDAINTAEREQEAWFLEGGTDYLALLLGYRSGVLTRDAFWDRIAMAWDRYRASADSMSLRRAGDDQGRRSDLVYSGGLLAALTLDVELRTATQGRAGIDSVLHRLFTDHGRTSTPVRHADIRAAARAIGGDAVDPLFDRHVDGTAPLPLARTLAAMGLVLRTEPGSGRSQIERSTEVTAAQESLERQLLGPPVR